IVRKMANSTLLGVASDVIRYHMEIRGLGIVNIKDIFGITAIRRKKQLDIVVELVRWESDGTYDRLGFEEARYEILGVELPHLRIPVSPGRSVATIVEVAARNQILKIMGYNPAGELEAHLNTLIKHTEKAEP
ncbi:MAG: HPr kinase/phosphorylase, partial [Deltaproteobacteria bacterium]|nr:HPr kinase/phosphorylase [Deltaproteobacteria bacterium]